MTNAVFILVTVIDFAAALIIFAGALSERMRLYPTWHKVGLITAAFGLLAQGVRNVQFLVTGTSPSDADAPFWVLKDVGIALIAFFYAYIGYKGWQESKNKLIKTTQTKPRKPRK